MRRERESPSNPHPRCGLDEIPACLIHVSSLAPQGISARGHRAVRRADAEQTLTRSCRRTTMSDDRGPTDVTDRKPMARRHARSPLPATIRSVHLCDLWATWSSTPSQPARGELRECAPARVARRDLFRGSQALWLPASYGLILAEESCFTSSYQYSAAWWYSLTPTRSSRPCARESLRSSKIAATP